MLLAERGLIRQLGKLKLSERTKRSVWTLINGGYGGGRAIASELLKMVDFGRTATVGVIFNLEVVQLIRRRGLRSTCTGIGASCGVGVDGDRQINIDRGDWFWRGGRGGDRGRIVDENGKTHDTPDRASVIFGAPRSRESTLPDLIESVNLSSERE